MNARDRVNRGRELPGRPPPDPPATAYRAAMDCHARRELEAWHARRVFSYLGQGAAILGAILGACWHGPPGAILGAAVWWIYRQAMPGPSDTLDEYTNRKGR